MATSVLIIDDDEGLNTLLTEYLGRFGYLVRTATHPDAGLRALRTENPDIIILDVMLPDMDGFAVCRKVRETRRVPIIMLTARGDVMDRILGLELGADDYLPKPFEPRELVARMQSVLRRGNSVADEHVRAADLELNLATRTARLRGSLVPLTSAEFELAALLVRNRGRILSRERILEEIRGHDWDSFDRSIDVLVSRLRQKLGDDARNPAYVRTVRGAGYLFIGGDHSGT
jgi:two-component system phosphate regulon response regulator OmpR